MSPKREKSYTTQKGKDERIIENPTCFGMDTKEILAERGLQVHNWHGYQTLYGKGINMNYFNTIENMRNREESIIIIVTAKPGRGKTYNALRFAEMFDEKFDVNLQVCFTREQILYLIGSRTPLKRGQAIIVDEAQFTAGARNWFEEVQKMLINSLASIRSKGFIIIIVALHLDMMDKIIRKYVLSFMHHMEERGKAIVYQLYTPRFEKEMHKKRITELYLKLPGIESCTHSSCLNCDHRSWCNNIRAVYERNKLAFINMKTDEAEAKALAKSKRDLIPTKKELLEIIIQHKDRLSLTSQKGVHWSSIQDILDDEFGYEVGRSMCVGLADSVKRKHKDVIAQLLKDQETIET